MTRRSLRWLQWGLTIALLAWLFRKPDEWLKTIAAIEGAHLGWLLAALALVGIDQVFNILRWGIYLRVQNVSASWKQIIKVFMAGLFFNLLLPGMVSGDIVKVALFGAAMHGKWRQITLSVVADRLIGLIALVLVSLFFVLFRYEWLTQTPTAAALLWGLILASLGATALLAASFALSLPACRERLPQRFPGRTKLLEIAETWLVFAKEWKKSFLAFLLSFPVLFTYFGVFWCCAQAFSAGVSFSDFSAVMPVITVASSIPITPGALGIRENLFSTLLDHLAGVDPQVAALISLTGFLAYALWSISGVFFCAAELPDIFAKTKNAIPSSPSAGPAGPV